MNSTNPRRTARRAASWWHRLRHDRRAVAALEFAVVGPTFLLFVFTALGAGMNGLYQIMLDDAVRDTARQLQMNGPAATTPAAFVTALCNRFGLLASNCSATITFNVRANPAATGFAGLTRAALSPAGALNNAFLPGGALTSGAYVLIQVAYPLPFSLPYVGTMLTATGTNSIISTSTIRAEPLG